MSESLTVGSLFAGIGGFDLGLERAGMTVKWQVEIDPFCQRVLATHWPTVRRHANIRACGSWNLPSVDVLCGGFPCQDISVAGNGAGIDGERSGLWSEYARLIRELRPRYVLVENVAALLVRGLERVLRDLAACGYDAEWDCIPASAVGGCHGRDRLWLVAYPAGQRGPGLVESLDPCSLGSWRSSGQADLQALTAAPFIAGDRWPQPLLRRMDDGLSDRMDRLHGIGNAIVPQIAEWLGQRIINCEAQR